MIFQQSIDFWDQRYSTEEYVYGTEPNDYLKSQINLFNPGDNVLCIADGEGRNSIWLSEQGMSVTGFDYSRVAVSKAQKLSKQKNAVVEFFTINMYQFDYKSLHYDKIVSIFVPHNGSEKRKKCHQDCFNALKPGGYFICEFYSPEQISKSSGGPSDPNFLFEMSDVLSDFPDGIIIHSWNGDRYLHEGPLHNGMSSVVQIVIQKPLT